MHARRALFVVIVLVLLPAAGCGALDSSADDPSGEVRPNDGTAGTVAPAVDPVPARVVAGEDDQCPGRALESGFIGNSVNYAAGACSSSTDCGDGFFCDFYYGRCGEVQEGRCEPRPIECDGVDEPVCGCDGEIHLNQCEAARAGVAHDLEGRCQVPDGQFVCGAWFCALGEFACSLTVSHINAMPYGHSCVCIPDICRPLETSDEMCGCLDVPGWCGCSGTREDGFGIGCGDL